MLNRLAASSEELQAEELRQDAESAGCMPIASCQDRQQVTVTGTLRAVTLRPRAGVPALEAELFDGTVGNQTGFGDRERMAPAGNADVLDL